MHLQLYQLIAYRDGALDISERQAVFEHLSECAECRARHAAFEHIALSLKDYFARYRPAKGSDCSDAAHWRRYLNGELQAQDQLLWKAHLQQCDYCFDVAASLTKEAIRETSTEPLRPPEWLLNKVEASEEKRRRSSLQKLWTDFTLWLRDFWENLVAPPKWAYAVAGFIIVLFFGLLVWRQLPYTDRVTQLAELPGKSVQLDDNIYQLLAPEKQVRPDLPASSEEWHRWYNALTGDEKEKFVIALLTSSFAEALRMLGGSQQAEGLERLMAELKAQVIELPSSPIGGVLLERPLAEQLFGGTYTQNQHLLITFLTPDKTAPTAQTVLKIETSR